MIARFFFLALSFFPMKTKYTTAAINARASNTISTIINGERLLGQSVPHVRSWHGMSSQGTTPAHEAFAIGFDNMIVSHEQLGASSPTKLVVGQAASCTTIFCVNTSKLASRAAGGASQSFKIVELHGRGHEWCGDW